MHMLQFFAGNIVNAVAKTNARTMFFPGQIVATAVIADYHSITRGSLTVRFPIFLHTPFASNSVTNTACLFRRRLNSIISIPALQA